MEFHDFIDKQPPFIKQNLLPLGLGLLGLMFLGYGLIALIGSSNSSREIIFEPGSDSVLSSESSNESKASQIVVDVEGAVLKPGVHYISSNSRLQDALIAAGGLASNADRDWVTKNVNLAAKLADGAKIYIPKIGESGTESIKSIKSIKGVDAEDEININTASEQALDSLTGIGPVTAQKIINGRPYASIDDLLSKKIVGSKVFEEIKEKISVY